MRLISVRAPSGVVVLGIANAESWLPATEALPGGPGTPGGLA
jgi:hypothetical protein